MQLLTFEQLIRSHITLSKHPNSNGWWGVLCKVCNDHGRKGKRAGFRFDENNAGYNCFNCGCSAGYDYNFHTFSKEMTEVLDAFNIPQEERNQVLFYALSTEHSTEKQYPKLIIEPNTIELPSFFSPLTNSPNDEIDQYACEYLQTRQIDWKEYPFYISQRSSHPDSKKWYGRLIIPIYKDNRLIFYMGRDLTDLRSRKYLSPSIPKDNVLYGYDELMRNTDDPIYIAEGWFDVFRIKGVAVFGNRMTPNQVMWLNKSHREKVIIPDRFGDGQLLAHQAISYGWSVSTPFINDEVKDVNEAICKYGLSYTLLSIKKNTYKEFAATINTSLYCK